MLFKAKTKDVKLIVKSGYEFAINYQNVNADDFELEQTENEISLVQMKKASRLVLKKFRWVSQAKVIVTLPKDIDVCKLKATDAAIDVLDLKLASLQAKIKHGTIKIKNIEADDIYIRTNNGVAKAKNVSVKKTCVLEAKNGVSELATNLTEDDGLEVACDNGLVRLYGRIMLDKYQREGEVKYIVHCANGVASVKE